MAHCTICSWVESSNVSARVAPVIAPATALFFCIKHNTDYDVIIVMNIIFYDGTNVFFYRQIWQILVIRMLVFVIRRIEPVTFPFSIPFFLNQWPFLSSLVIQPTLYLVMLLMLWTLEGRDISNGTMLIAEHNTNAVFLSFTGEWQLWR